MKKLTFLFCLGITVFTCGNAIAVPPPPPNGVDMQHFGVFSIIHDLIQPYTFGVEQCRGIAKAHTTLCPESANCTYEIIVPYLLNNSTSQAVVSGGQILIVNGAKHTFPTTAPGDIVRSYSFSGSIDFSLTNFPNFSAKFNVATSSGIIHYKAIIQGPVNASLGIPCSAPSGYCYKDGLTGVITFVTDDMEALGYATFKTYLIRQP